ncbi:VOC family protein [Bacillus infantis]|uniref:VOC family protein n=1 Tax=Bacillus infantis TaxID=324767 RepID=UPI003CED83FA
MMGTSIVNRMNTVFVHVADLKKSAGWYCKLLGQKVTEPVENPVYNVKMDGETGLTLDAGSCADGKRPQAGPNPLFNLHTGDIHKAYSWMEKEGFDVQAGITHFDDFSFFNVKDPDGNIIMICTG